MALISEARQWVAEAGLDRLIAPPEFAAPDTWTAPLTSGALADGAARGQNRVPAASPGFAGSFRRMRILLARISVQDVRHNQVHSGQATDQYERLPA